MQRLAELVHDDGPRRIGLELLGQELALRIAPVGRIHHIHIGGQLVRADEIGNGLVTGIQAQLQEEIGHAYDGVVHEGVWMCVG